MSETIFYLKFALFILPTQCHISIYQCQCILLSVMLMGSTILVFGKCYNIRYFLVCHMLIVFFPFFPKCWVIPWKFIEWECLAQCQHMLYVSLTEVNIVNFEIEKQAREWLSDFPMITNKKFLVSNIISFFTNVDKTIPEKFCLYILVKTIIF